MNALRLALTVAARSPAQINRDQVIFRWLLILLATAALWAGPALLAKRQGIASSSAELIRGQRTVAGAALPGTFGSIDVNHSWKTVWTYTDAAQPVAIVGPPSFLGGDAGTSQLRLVDAWGFDLRFAEWSNLDGLHATERMDWLVLPAGSYQTNDGSIWEVGTLEVSGNGQWAHQNFLSQFDTFPYLFLTVQSNNGYDPVVVRAANLNRFGFDCAMFEEEASLLTGHAGETVGYLAVRPAALSGVVTIGDVTVPYLFQTEYLGSNSVDTGGGIHLIAQEDQTADAEKKHLNERTAILKLGDHVFAQDYKFREADPFSFRVSRDSVGIQLPAGFVIQQLLPASAFENAIAVEIAPDGRIFVAEERGLIWVVENGIKLPTPYLDLRDEVLYLEADDGALSGFALDPDFASNGYIYLSYTTQLTNETLGRVARFTQHPLFPNRIAKASKRILMGVTAADGLVHDQFHNVGDLKFGTDKSLLISWGDTAGNDVNDPAQLRPQNLDIAAGKIFRINRFTGQAYSSNPFYNGNPNDIRSKVWAYGLRNSFRFAVDSFGGGPFPAAGRPGTLFLAEVGRFNSDEFNFCRGGENFGWPYFEADLPFRAGNPGIDHTPPSLVFEHPQSRSVIGGAIYTGTAWPAIFHNAYFVGDFVEGWLLVVVPNQERTSALLLEFGSGIKGITDMEYDPLGDRLLFVGRGANVIFSNGVGLDGLYSISFTGY